MQRFHIILVLMLILTRAGSAQPSWAQIDSLTYSQYLSGEWKELLNETNKSLKEGIDFFYLRVRAGIAAYELKNYRLAAMHLEKAHAWNPEDAFVNYWYYYALEMAGRKDEARSLARGFSDTFLEEMKIKPVSEVSYILAETQLSINRDHAGLLQGFDSGEGSYIHYRNVLKQQRYKAIGIDHHLAAGKVFLFHGFSHLGISRTQSFSSNFLSANFERESSASQFQYYLQGRYLMPGGWSAHASLTWLWGESLWNWLTFSQTGTPAISDYRYSISDVFANASLAKELPWGRPEIGIAYGTINGFNQWQLNGQMALYPFGNTRFYISADYTLHQDESDPDLKMVFTPKTGIKTGPLWLIFHAVTGEIKNFGANDGYVIYNTPETIRKIYGATAYIPLLKYRLGLSLRYQLTEKEGMTFEYANTTDYVTSTYKLKENNYLISVTYSL